MLKLTNTIYKYYRDKQVLKNRIVSDSLVQHLRHLRCTRYKLKYPLVYVTSFDVAQTLQFRVNTGDCTRSRNSCVSASPRVGDIHPINPHNKQLTWLSEGHRRLHPPLSSDPSAPPPPCATGMTFSPQQPKKHRCLIRVITIRKYK